MDGSTDFPSVHTLDGLTDRSDISNIPAHQNHPLDLHIPQGDLHLVDEIQINQVVFCVWKIRTVTLCTWQSLDELVHRHVIYQNAPFQKYINVQWMG